MTSRHRAFAAGLVALLILAVAVALLRKTPMVSSPPSDPSIASSKIKRPEAELERAPRMIEGPEARALLVRSYEVQGALSRYTYTESFRGGDGLRRQIVTYSYDTDAGGSRLAREERRFVPVGESLNRLTRAERSLIIENPDGRWIVSGGKSSKEPPESEDDIRQHAMYHEAAVANARYAPSPGDSPTVQAVETHFSKWEVYDISVTAHPKEIEFNERVADAFRVAAIQALAEKVQQKRKTTQTAALVAAQAAFARTPHFPVTAKIQRMIDRKTGFPVYERMSDKNGRLIHEWAVLEFNLSPVFPPGYFQPPS